MNRACVDSVVVCALMLASRLASAEVISVGAASADVAAEVTPVGVASADVAAEVTPVGVASADVASAVRTVRPPFLAPSEADDALPWNHVDAWGQYSGRQVTFVPELTTDSFVYSHVRAESADRVAVTLGAYAGFTSRFGVSAGVMLGPVPLLSVGMHVFRGAGWVVADFGDADVQLGLSYPSFAVGGVLSIPAVWVRLAAPGFRCTLRDRLVFNLRPIAGSVWLGERTALSITSQVDLGVMF